MLPVLVRLNSTVPGPPVAGTDRAPFAVVDADQPLLRVVDSALEGDGVFESISVVDGKIVDLLPHLDRLNDSASALEIVLPDRGAVVAAVTTAVEVGLAGLPRDRVGAFPALAVSVVIIRESLSGPAGWVIVKPARSFEEIRSAGISVVSLDRGFAHNAGHSAPWLLLGVKQLSYAVNTAAVREARRRGAEDVIFLSSDGYVLEGPTSSVLLRDQYGISTPAGEAGILSGTTQKAAFEFFASHGIHTTARLIPATELATATAIWMVSSVRGAVAVTELNGTSIGVDPDTTAALNRFLASRHRPDH